MLLEIGPLCAMLAPLAWSVAVILFKQSGSIPGASLNLFKNLLAVVFLGITLLATSDGIPTDRSLPDWLMVAGSGFLGLSIADTLLFSGLSKIGASRLALVDTVYAPTVSFLSVVFLHEQLTPGFFLGAGVVIFGVTLAGVDWEKLGKEKLIDPELGIGYLQAWAAITCTATGVVLVKPVLEQSSLVEITWSRLVFGVLGQGIYLVLTGRLGGTLAVLRPSPVWKTMVPGAIIGTWLSLLLWLGGFKWAPASVAAVLNQLATVYILVLARIFLKERLTLIQAIGVLLAAMGALLVVLARG